MSAERVVAITMGDPTGIGPEIIAKVYADGDAPRALVVGDVAMMRRAIACSTARRSRSARSTSRPTARFEPGVIDVLRVTELPDDLPFGRVDARGGEGAFRYLEKAVELALADEVHAVATAPLNKEAMHLAGFEYPGHTEILAELTGVRDYAMMLVADQLRVVHVSTHVALSEAIRRVQPERELTVIRLADRSLRQLGIDEPRVAVAGLNPHAGEDGLFGTEDRDVIAPAVEAARAEGIDASGPWPPDTVFMQARQGRFDIVVVQYHDQGHIPIKLMGFDDGRQRHRRPAVLPHERRPRHGVRHRRHRAAPTTRACAPRSTSPPPSPDRCTPDDVPARTEHALNPIEIVRPEALEFGPGSIAAVARFASARGLRRPLVIADPFNAQRVELLGLDGRGRCSARSSLEPDLANLDAALAVKARLEPDLIIGFGGGSAMDLAKLVAVLPAASSRSQDVVGAEHVHGPLASRWCRSRPPSGTGSEGGTRALVTDPATQNKLAVQSRHMLADLAVVDPDLTLTVPPAVTAATGVDAHGALRRGLHQP